MQVVKFIQEKGFEALTTELGIRVKVYEDHRGYRPDVVLLDYNQIESPKTHPVVMECRGLTLRADTLEVVARGYDRFFNLGEALNVTPEINWGNAKLFEKVDGSFIKIYYYGDHWEIATRGTAYAITPCMGFPITFRELVYMALGVDGDDEFQELMESDHMDRGITYLFELTSLENRVVKHYEGYKLHFLGARNKHTGKFESHWEKDWLSDSACGLSDIIHFPKEYTFQSEEECRRVVGELKDLDEGYVLYQNEIPIVKIKSPAYVAIHHIRGEGLNPKRMAELVLSNEVDEYLTYFQTDRKFLQPFMDAYARMHSKFESVYENVRHIEDQKEFAQAISGLPYKGVFFTARLKGITPKEAFDQARIAGKIETLQRFM